MNRDRNELLQARLDQNYQDYLAQLREKPFDEIVKLAPEITAAQQLCDELAAVCGEEEAEYLLGLDNPLEVVRGYWEREISGYDHGEEMGHMLWHLRGCGRESPEAALTSKTTQSGFTQTPPPQKPKMELVGHDGNIFSIMGRASFLLQMAGMNAENKEMVDRVTSCEDYNKALNIISEYVDTELSTPSIEPKKSHKKKGKSAYER